MFYLYILKNKDGKIYIGQTFDLEKRLVEHNYTGLGYTSKFRPWILVHSETFQSRKEAMAREKFYKSGKGRDEIKGMAK